MSAGTQHMRRQADSDLRPARAMWRRVRLYIGIICLATGLVLSIISLIKG